MWGVPDGAFAVLYLLLAAAWIGVIVAAKLVSVRAHHTRGMAVTVGSLTTYDIALLRGPTGLLETVLCALWDARLVRISSQGRVSRFEPAAVEQGDPYAAIALNSITINTGPRAVLKAIIRSDAFSAQQGRLVDLGLLARPSTPAYIKMIGVIMAGVGIAWLVARAHLHTSATLVVLIEVSIVTAISLGVVLLPRKAASLTEAGRNLILAIRSGRTELTVPQRGALAVAVTGTQGFKDPSVRRGLDAYFDTGVGASPS